MFKVDDFVAITGGAWAGHRGIVRAIHPNAHHERPVLLVTLERESARGMHGYAPGTVTSLVEHYVAYEHCAHLDVI